MKKVTALGLFFFCVIVLSSSPPSSAHNGESAKDASTGDTQEDMKGFLRHLKSHQMQITDDDGQVEFRNALRTNNGVWRHDDTYLITVNGSAVERETGSSFEPGDVIFFHAKYPAARSGSLKSIQIFRQLTTMLAEGADGEEKCVQDPTGRYGNHICAVKDSHADSSGALNSFIQIVGFNHEPDEVDHSKAQEACREFTPDDLESRGWLSADMVADEKSLVRYLEGVVEHISEELERRSGNNAQGGVSLVRMIELLSPLAPCWRMPPWEHGSIYFYIVTDTDKMFGIFNGNTPQLQGTTLRLVDDNGVRIAQRILKEVRRQDDTPNRGFLTYLWDDPTVRGDEVVCKETGPVPGPTPEDEGVSCEAGNPIPGRSTGTSVKQGYFIRTNFGVGETHYVVGSGIYPKSRESDGGGGCAIVSGSGDRHEVGAFNLFLTAAALFLAAASGKRCPGAELLTFELRVRRKKD